MITVRLSPAMQEIVRDHLAASLDLRRSGAERVTGEPGALALLGVQFSVLRADPSKKIAILAGFAEARILTALDRARVVASTIPVSITTEEKDTLAALARNALANVTQDARVRLERRELIRESARVAGWAVTNRGRALLASTPPGDLVPFSYFAPGVRVRLAADVQPSDDAADFVAERLRAGAELVVSATVDGRVELSTSEWVAIERAHPKIFYVLGRAAT